MTLGGDRQTIAMYKGLSLGVVVHVEGRVDRANGDMSGVGGGLGFGTGTTQTTNSQHKENLLLQG